MTVNLCVCDSQKVFLFSFEIYLARSRWQRLDRPSRAGAVSLVMNLLARKFHVEDVTILCWPLVAIDSWSIGLYGVLI